MGALYIYIIQIPRKIRPVDPSRLHRHQRPNPLLARPEPPKGQSNNPRGHFPRLPGLTDVFQPRHRIPHPQDSRTIQKIHLPQRRHLPRLARLPRRLLLQEQRLPHLFSLASTHVLTRLPLDLRGGRAVRPSLL